MFSNLQCQCAFSKMFIIKTTIYFTKLFWWSFCACALGKCAVVRSRLIRLIKKIASHIDCCNNEYIISLVKLGPYVAPSHPGWSCNKKLIVAVQMVRSLCRHLIYTDTQVSTATSLTGWSEYYWLFSK